LILGLDLCNWKMYPPSKSAGITGPEESIPAPQVDIHQAPPLQSTANLSCICFGRFLNLGPGLARRRVDEIHSMTPWGPPRPKDKEDGANWGEEVSRKGEEFATRVTRGREEGVWEREVFTLLVL